MRNAPSSTPASLFEPFAATEERAPALAPERWAQLASAVGLASDAELVVALSGGADSVFLLEVLARARPRPRVHAVHVDHGLRGVESDGDAEFCGAACARLGIPFERVRVELDGEAPDLEHRARVARHRALCRVAARLGVATIATGHHADDSLENLLLRWTRGSELPTFAGVPRRTRLSARDPARGRDDDALNPTDRELVLVRPLFAMKREEVREALRAEGVAWREDTSNASAAFSRNRVRHALLPALREVCGSELEHLRAFARAVEDFESGCARATSAIAWSPPWLASARRGTSDARLGGSLERAKLASLAEPLARRALWRLCLEGTGRAPSRAALDELVRALAAGAVGERTLAGGWRLALRTTWIHLDPPATGARRHARKPRDDRARQLALPFEAPAHATLDDATSAHATPGRVAIGEHVPDPAELDAWRLDLPGRARLPDGRSVLAEIVELGPEVDVPRSPGCVELDATDLVGPLAVRWPRPGDRFHALGAPGSRPLGRFLRDAGVPRHDRDKVALVCAGAEVLWVAGVRPCEARRVGRRTEKRLRLRVEWA